MSDYAARICWNSRGWREPTGEAAKLESSSYAQANGFGHEEWLFDPHAALDGWQYGFLQPVSRVREKRGGQAINVGLFTVAGPRKRFYVGRLPKAEILTLEQARGARRRFEASGRLSRMERQLKALGAKVAGLAYPDPRWIVNIRYPVGTEELLSELAPVPVGDVVTRLNRYVLTSLSGDRERARREWPQCKSKLPIGEGVPVDDVLPTPGETDQLVQANLVGACDCDRASRAACLRHHGTRCCVCAMSFEAMYGARFKDSIHVHQLVPPSVTAGPRILDPVADLRPVCPNCHVALHAGNPPLAPEELRGLLRAAAARDGAP